jgi:AcrR family transcriptional regulator
MVSGFVFGEMGCKRTGSSQEERILQTALDLIVNQGYYATSIKGITARVGISKAVPYSYFKTKGELVLRLIEEYKTRFADEVVRIKDEHQGHTVQGTRSNYAFEHTVWIRTPGIVAIFHVYIQHTEQRPCSCLSWKKSSEERDSWADGLGQARRVYGF